MQDKEILSILEKLEPAQSTGITESDRISGYFCSDTVANLRKKSCQVWKLKFSKKG